VPPNYGGYETTVNEVSRRFVKRGYTCVVYCRKSSYPGERPERHEGRKLVYVKGSSRPELDTFVSAFQTGWHLLRHRSEYDYVLWFNNANLPGIVMTLLAGLPMSINTDGLEWRRAKWRWPFKAYAFLASFLVSRICKSLISDARAIQSYYKKTFFKDTEFIPYGIPDVLDISSEKEAAVLERYGLEAGRYFLQLTRFEPENHVLDTAKAFRDAGLAKEGFKLLLLGYKDSPYARQVKAMSGKDGIVVPDYESDPEVKTVLWSNCFCYVHGNSVGGTNPGLLEAMANCPRVIAIDVAFSREVLGDTGYFFTLDNMAKSLREVLNYPDRSAAMQNRVRSHYDWEAVAESYMRLVEGRPANYSPPAIAER
jgi:glycosyltransferase involved in cell wall biosynthesis